MTNNLIPLTELTLSLGLAYVLHSTLLLIGVAALLRAGRASSHTLRERLWKLAVVVPLLTSPLQVWSGAASIPDGWRVSVVSVDERTSNEQVSVFHVASSSESDGDLAISSEAASGIVPSPPRGEGARRAGEGPAESRTGMPTPASETPSSGLRPPSPRRGEGTETAFPSAAPADLQATAVLPIAELAPVEPLPESTATHEPRATQPDWPPTEPPQTSRSELAMTPETTLVKVGVASTSDVRPKVVASTSSTVAATRRRPAVRLDPVAFGFALAVLASLGGGLFLLIVQRGRFWRRLRKCRVVADGVTRSELDKLLNRKQIRRRVRLLVSDGFVEPVACGVLRWTIIVPHGVEQRLNRDQIEGLLAHELAHLVRGDTAWLWVGNIVCSCLWFQPLNFLARRRWQQAAEFLSDEWAVADANVSPLSLAQCLTKIAEWRLDRQESGAILAAGGHRSTLSSRIDCLVQDERPHDAWKSRRRKRAVLVGVLAAGGALVWSVPRAEFVHADSPPRSGTGSDAGEVETEKPSVPAEEESPPAVNPGHGISETGVNPLTPGGPPETFIEARAPQTSADWQAEWNELQAELKGLNADLIRVAGLLEKYPGDVRVRELAEQIRARAVSFEARRQSLDERIKASQKDPDAATASPFYLKDDVQYFPPGPEFQLQQKASDE